MAVCLLTSESRHSSAGERIAALAQRLDATVATTTAGDWPGAVPIDELDGSFDAAIAFGWRACVHLFRADARGYAYFVPALEEADLWQGDERRLLIGITLDLPIQLITDSDAVAATLRERNPDVRVATVPRWAADARGGAGARGEADAHKAAEADARAAGGPLRVAFAAEPEGLRERISEPIEVVDDIAAADVVVELNPPERPLDAAFTAIVAGRPVIVTPVRGHGELIRDGVNGLVVEFDDVPGAARAITALARDHDVLARLREGARATPVADIDQAADVLRALLADLPPAAGARRLLLNARAALEPIAAERRALEEALRAHGKDLADAAARIAELDGVEAEAAQLRRTLDEQRQAYKVGHALRPLWRPFARLKRRR